MVVKFLLVVFIIVTIMIVYACVMTSLPYDRNADDWEQMKFLEEWRKAQEKKKNRKEKNE